MICSEIDTEKVTWFRDDIGSGDGSEILLRKPSEFKVEYSDGQQRLGHGAQTQRDVHDHRHLV